MREWATVQRKKAAEDARRDGQSGGAGDDKLCPCEDVRFDGIGEDQITDDELGLARAQLQVLGLLYFGCKTIWYTT